MLVDVVAGSSSAVVVDVVVGVYSCVVVDVAVVEYSCVELVAALVFVMGKYSGVVLVIVLGESTKVVELEVVEVQGSELDVVLVLEAYGCECVLVVVVTVLDSVVLGPVGCPRVVGETVDELVVV